MQLIRFHSAHSGPSHFADRRSPDLANNWRVSETFGQPRETASQQVECPTTGQRKKPPRRAALFGAVTCSVLKDYGKDHGVICKDDRFTTKDNCFTAKDDCVGSKCVVHHFFLIEIWWMFGSEP